MRVADYIADFLVENGITQMFMLTGGGAMFLNDAFGHKKGLDCVYNHHEQACAIAAEGYTRVNGKLCAVCVTTGPGGTNALTGVLGSWLDSIPMIVISGQVKFSTTIKSCPELPLRQLGDQEFNITDCVKTMTKYAYMVTDPYSIKYHLQKALYLATHGRPGPVWLDIPINVQSAQIDVSKLASYDEIEDRAKEVPPRPSKEQMTELLERIKNAKRPVILAGEGIRIANVKEKFLKLVDKLQIPVTTAWNAHDLVADDNPYYCGRPGTAGTRGGNFVVQKADFLLSLGCRMNIRQISYNYENFAKNAYLAYVDIDKAELYKPTLNVKMKIHADVRDVLDILLEMDYEPQTQHQRWLKWGKEVNNRYPAVLDCYYEKKTPINPYVFMKELGIRLDEDETIVLANGTACICTNQAIPMKRHTRMFANSGCASMGYGLPAAIGAAKYLNGKRVICLEGDGSIQMNIQELQTVVHNKLNIKIFWFNNEGYHSIRQTQTNAFNCNFCGICQNTGLSFPSAEKIAYAYGLPFYKADNVEHLGEVLDKVLAADGPLLCEMVFDKEQFFEPKLSSKTLADGTIVSPSLEDMYPFLPEGEVERCMSCEEEE